MKNFVSVKFKEADMEEYDGAHHYSFDGQKSVGITSILFATKPEEDAAKLADWKVNEDKRWGTPSNYIFKTSGPIGTDTHNAVESYLKGEEYSPKYTISKGHLMNLKPLLSKIDNIRTTESRLFSKELSIAGTVDCIAEYDGVLSVIDFKTKRSDRKEEWIVDNFLQATAYSIMWEELTGEKIPQIVILISTEKNSNQCFIKNPDDYKIELNERLDKYYDKYSQVNQGKRTDLDSTLRSGNRNVTSKEKEAGNSSTKAAKETNLSRAKAEKMNYVKGYDPKLYEQINNHKPQ